MPSTRGANSCRATAAATVLAAAFAVAALVARAPADFAAAPLVTIIRNDAGRPLWSIRLAAAAHQIAVDVLDARDAAPLPEDRAHQLWLLLPDGPHSLGLLPRAGRKVIAEIPAIIALLARPADLPGQLIVTVEPARGSDLREPSGPIAFRGRLGDTRS